MKGGDEMDIEEYIKSLSATDKLLLKRKLMGIKKCPDKRRVEGAKVHQLPEEIALTNWRNALTPESQALIIAFEELTQKAKTARFNVGIRKGF